MLGKPPGAVGPRGGYGGGSTTQTPRRAPWRAALALGALGAVLLALALLSPPTGATGSGDWPPPATGNWFVQNTTVISNETVQVNGTLYVYYSTLTLDNVTLLINSTPSAQRGVYVYGSPSRLTITNSNVTTFNPATRFFFYNYGNLSVERSTLSRTGTWGILTYAPTVTIRNNEIYNGSYGGISAFFYASQSGITIENNTLYDIDYFAMFLQYYSYFGAGAGPHNIEGDFIIRGNTVRDNIGGGIYLYRYFYDYLNTASSMRSNLTVRDNQFLRNRGPALYVYNSIWNGQGGDAGNVSFVGRLDVTGNRFEGNAAYQAVFLENAITASFSGSAHVDLGMDFSRNVVVNNSGAGVYIDYINSADHSSQADVGNDGAMVFEGNTIQRNQGYGLRIYRYANAWLARNASINGTIAILNNTVTNNADAGIYVWNYAFATDAYSALIDGPVRIEGNVVTYNSGYGIYTYNYAQKYQGDANGTAEIRGPLTVRGNEVAFNLGYNAVQVTRSAASYTGSTAYIGGDIAVVDNRVYNNSGNGINVAFSAYKNLGKASGTALIESNLTLEGNWVANNSLFIGVSIDRTATTYYSSSAQVTGFTRIRSNLIEGHDSNGLILQQRTLNYYGSAVAESLQRGDVLFEDNTIRRNNAAAAYLYFYSYSYYSTSSRVEANYTVRNNTVTDNQAVGLWAYFQASANTAISGDTQMVSQVVVEGNDFSRNKGQGLLLYRQAISSRTGGNDAAVIGSVRVSNNVADSNLNEGLYLYDYVSNSQGDEGASARIVGNYTIQQNTLTNNLGYYGGLVLFSVISAYQTETAERAATVLATNNTIRGNSGFGAYLSLTGSQYFFRSASERGAFTDTSSFVVSDNVVDSNSRTGLFVQFALDSEAVAAAGSVRVFSNTISGNLGGSGLYLRVLDTQSFIQVEDNEISANRVDTVVLVENEGKATALGLIHNNLQSNRAQGAGVRVDFSGSAYNLTVERNNATGNDVAAGPMFDFANNGRTVIQYNRVQGGVNETAVFNLSAPGATAWITVENNTVTGNAGKALYIVSEGLVSVAYNLASNNSRDGLAVLTQGDYLSSLARITIANNTADNNGGNGVWAFATNRLYIFDNRARGNGLAGIRINFLASAPQVERNVLAGNRYGLLLSGNGTSPLTASYPVRNLNILDSLLSGLFVDDVAIALYDSTFDSTSGVDLSVRQARIDGYGARVRFMSGEVRGSGEIHIWWNLSFRVMWQSGAPVPGALIQMNGSDGREYGAKAANSTGRVAPFPAEEWAMVDANRYPWSPYTFTATKSGEQGSNTTALDREKEVWIYIEDIHAPAVVLDAPVEGAIFNLSYFRVFGNVTDAGSGLQRILVEADGVTWLREEDVQEPYDVSRAIVATVGALPDGNYTLAVRVLDLAGLETAVYVNVTLDTTPPRLEVLRPLYNLTNLSVVTVVVQTDPDVAQASIGYDTVLLRADATITSVVRIFEGPNVFRIRATDRAGNLNETFLSITLDTTPPPLALTTPQDGFLTNQALLPVRGTSEPGARVWVNGAEVTVDPSGAFDGAAQLTEGNNTLAVEAQDAAGNWRYLRVQGALDRTPPQLVVNSPAEGLVTKDDFVSVEGAAEQDAVVYVNGKGVLALGVFRESVFLTEGVNNITVTARDGAGNEARVTRTVVKDTTVPSLDILDPAGGHGFTHTPTYTIRGVTEPFARVTAGAFAVVADAGGAFALAVNLSQEETIFRIEAVDVIGNRNATAVTITLDTSAPSLTIYSPKDGARFQVGSAEIAGSTEFGSLLTVNGESVQVAPDGFFRWIVPLRSGANNVTVRSADSAGNTAEVSLTLWLGGGAPTEPAPTSPGGGGEGLTTPGGGGGEAFFLIGILLAVGAAAGVARWFLGRRGEQE